MEDELNRCFNQFLKVLIVSVCIAGIVLFFFGEIRGTSAF